MTRPTLILIAKQPLPGRVKTRLVGAVSAVQAAKLAECALRDTLQAVGDGADGERVLLLDGAAGSWLPPGWRVVPQVAGELDERLSAGFEQVGAGPAVLVGMDTPQLTLDHLAPDLDKYDACLGLAADGGYWAIGFAEPARARSVIKGIRMSRHDTGAEQLRRMHVAGMRVQQLAVLTDVDTADSAEEVAAGFPQLSFARAWRELTASGITA